MSSHHSGPASHKGQDPSSVGRRTFLGTAAWAMQGAIAAFMTIPLVRYVLHPVLDAAHAGERWLEVGPIAGMPVGEPQRRILTFTERDGWAERAVEKAVWILRNPNDTVSVFTAVCPHLGCTINWKTESKNFNCACHQSYFDLAGKLISGPSPRPMDDLEYKIEGGSLSVKYQNFKQGTATKEVLS